MHPDVLAAVADEIAYPTEVDVNKAYQKALLRLHPMEVEKADCPPDKVSCLRHNIADTGDRPCLHVNYYPPNAAPDYSRTWER